MRQFRVTRISYCSCVRQNKATTLWTCWVNPNNQPYLASCRMLTQNVSEMRFICFSPNRKSCTTLSSHNDSSTVQIFYGYVQALAGKALWLWLEKITVCLNVEKVSSGVSCWETGFLGIPPKQLAEKYKNEKWKRNAFKKIFKGY